MFHVDLFRTPAAHETRCVVGGGLALSPHGVQRARTDVDLALALGARNPGAGIDLSDVAALEAVERLGLDR